MSKNIRIKRRRTGAAGPPSALLNAELAYNEVGGVLYYGAGLGANTRATAVIAIGGPGAFVSLVGNQTVAGDKQFSNTVTFNSNVFAPNPDVSNNSNAVATTSYVRAYVQTQTTDNVVEGATNLYYTSARSNAAALEYLAPIFDGKANIVHTHSPADIVGLFALLGQKLNLNAAIDSGELVP
jgi:hypothetical protein